MHSILQEPEINKYIQKLYRGKCLYATMDNTLPYNRNV